MMHLLTKSAGAGDDNNEVFDKCYKYDPIDGAVIVQVFLLVMPKILVRPFPIFYENYD